jgi:hypothetical protein
MAQMYHGTLHYAAYGRKVSGFGGKAAESTLRIYDTRDCGRELRSLSKAETAEWRNDVRTQRKDREFIEDQLIGWLAQ